MRSPGEVERFAWSGLALRLEAFEAQLLGLRPAQLELVSREDPIEIIVRPRDGPGS